MSVRLNMEYASGSDIGRVRQRNEDCVMACQLGQSEIILLLVADGVGGHAGGDIASRLAIDCIQQHLEKAVLQAQSGGGYNKNWLDNRLADALRYANRTIREGQIEQPEYEHMSTTIVGMLIHENEAVISHLGDSRCYDYKQDCLTQLTEDHTVLQTLLNQGKINQEEFELMPMHHMIDQALGLCDHPDIRINHLELSERQRFLLCSDGLTNCVSDIKIQDLISSCSNMQSCVDTLITHANDNGGIDNISVVLVDITGG